MNIDEAIKHAGRQPAPRETLHVIGNIEQDSTGKVRVYPDPYDLSHYVLVDRDSLDGDVLDVTEHARQTNPSRRGPVYSVPVRKGAEIQIVSVKTIPITDPARMRFLSLNQSGCGSGESGCGCHGGDDEKVRRSGCHTGHCTTVEGVSYSCWETWHEYVLCSGCCYIV
jgi:hypothetical protein